MSSLRVTSLRGRTGNASPTLPDGAVVTGVVTATSFSGDGSSLTGVAATDNVSTSTLNVVGVSTFNNNIRFDAIGLFPYSQTLNFGSNTSQEGQLYATSEYFYINAGNTSGVYVQTNGFIQLKSGTGSDKYIEMNSHPNHNGEVSLYYDGDKKLETTASGVSITGDVTATSFSGGFTELDAALFN